MKEKLLSIIALVAIVGTLSAQTADYKLNVQNFCELTVVDGIGVDYYCLPDSAGWTVFTCEPELASRIMFNNKAEHLTIQTDADESPIAGMPRIKVYSASLRRVENSGDSLVRVYAGEPVKSFKARQIGNGMLEIHNIDATNVDLGIAAGRGRLKVDGKASKASISNVSTGPIDASDLAADEVKCLVFGTGDIECRPAKKLRVFGAGSGAVLYHSVPEKITNRGIGVKTVHKEPDLAANDK